ncbi:inorganic phosphate transporter [Haloarcula onubensis]|uniref:Phosphate transporter n=1 Tax=Haloarcula onubensis TaxID=2950539 RepID=A0ABU2FNX8_9EURY|nr:anion permease [Halomicroarcula sp. S3CR25-11]MDS0282455.1 anion permease [Halomicroarcula sp. S3CR25-11]
MVEVLFALGLVVAVFVGFNIGGSSTGVAFGPAVGSNTLSKLSAAALMTVFALAGGLLVGPAVVQSLGSDLVATPFSPLISIAVLFFIGTALFLSNVVGVPASTSMTAVGAIAGLGLARKTLNADLMLEIVVWWLVSPIVAFWVSGVIGRYFYPTLVRWFAVSQSEGDLLDFDRSGAVPRPRLGERTTPREFVGTAVVIGIGCYMAFSAGASNVANAVAPLVGNGSLDLYPAILLGGAAIGLGAFTIARRTMDTVGNDLTDLPLVAAIVVATVASTIVTFLSALGIPASFVIIATMSIVGLGWGRATRMTRLSDTVTGHDAPDVSVGALAADADDAPTVGGSKGTPEPSEPDPIGEESSEDIPRASDLFEPATTARVIFLQNVVPSIATVAAYLVFRFLPVF